MKELTNFGKVAPSLILFLETQEKKKNKLESKEILYGSNFPQIPLKFNKLPIIITGDQLLFIDKVLNLRKNVGK